MNADQLSLVPCPSCKGRGLRSLIHQLPGVYVPVQWRNKTQACLACKATGAVESWRVCAGCGNWRDSCTCRPSLVISVVAMPVVESSIAPALDAPRGEVESVAADPERIDPAPTEAVSDRPPPSDGRVKCPPRRPKRARPARIERPACVWGIEGCELADQGEGFWFCRKCCYAEQR